MKEEAKLVIENLERYSEWLELEYKHCAELWNNLMITNIKDSKLIEKMSKFSNIKISESSIAELAARKRIVLDPFAEKELTTNDFDDIEEIVIGGNLGNEKLTGKTKFLITDRLKNSHTKPRNLGKKQLSIDSSAFVAKLIYLGMELKDIEVTSEVEILFDNEYSVILPYGYPIVNGRVIITPGVVEYLGSK
jgi:ribosome biogenesis SPOUT family RNA methylase Rps3